MGRRYRKKRHNTGTIIRYNDRPKYKKKSSYKNHNSGCNTCSSDIQSYKKPKYKKKDREYKSSKYRYDRYDVKGDSVPHNIYFPVACDSCSI